MTEIKTKEQELIRLANQDSLTGIANRHQFINWLDEYIRLPSQPAPSYLMMLDLDNFKHVNDSLGHHAGDQLLRHLSAQIKSVLPEEALLARLGGDEFAILIRHTNTQEVSQASAEKLSHSIREAVATPFNLHGHRIESKISIGISFAPQDGLDPNEVLKAADIALYHAKEKRNRSSFFTDYLKQKTLYKQRLLNDLQVAIDEQQFFLVYQPQFNLTAMQLTSFEALIRWQHPELGQVTPDDFIPLTESSQLIIPLGEWVLQQACEDALHWPESINVAVNVSAIQLEYSDFGEAIENTIRSTGLARKRLELELTESSIMNNSERNMAILEAFRASGGRIAIDDFGTGFSSFSYLHSFPLDKLKIDRSFIQLLSAELGDNSAMTIVNSIVKLGIALELQVTAEGIETEAQHQHLKSLECQLGQGYFYAKPMTAAQLHTFIPNSTSQN
ncbi:EAL domain-containing protein [Paraglaciecola aquimarina]|uniref:EAL domain-containing protein n=1 Tax=Paraglaciecola aquimarina TaxID=1235557 RepID=A0ABU3SU26_9ALTE|nr:EAL domain-containing protein [Paraglaciecola aquimarina]MDU0353519.1 EAL domain-containing protein [Paraglaciecola aquimarina]